MGRRCLGLMRQGTCLGIGTTDLWDGATALELLMYQAKVRNAYRPEYGGWEPFLPCIPISPHAMGEESRR